jgi:hypothetical protein
MLLGIVLLYVGAVLAVNGIWLIGTARTTAATSAGYGGGTAEVSVEAHSTFIQGREVAILNIFTGAIGSAIAIFFIVQGGIHNNSSNIASAGLILLFAFTYFWVAANQFLNAGGHAFGWYCLFVAVTAVPTGVYTLLDAHGNAASIWLGVDWFAWAVLWFMFFLLLALERPIARVTGWVAVIEGVGTSWALGYALLQTKLTLG